MHIVVHEASALHLRDECALDYPTTADGHEVVGTRRALEDLQCNVGLFLCLHAVGIAVVGVRHDVPLAPVDPLSSLSCYQGWRQRTGHHSLPSRCRLSPTCGVAGPNAVTLLVVLILVDNLAGVDSLAA